MTLDLTSCEREPIHIPGAIQAHGFLLALREPDLAVMQLSANLADLLGRAPDTLLQRPLAEVLGLLAADAVRGALACDDLQESLPLRLQVQHREFDASLHRYQRLVILELEPALPQPADISFLLARAIQRLQAAGSLSTLKDIAVQEVRRLTGFDRVMLYRFDVDGHGEVWAECKAEELDPFLGLHYPASDIPRQARELYRVNWLRLIPDAGYQPVPLLPQLRPDTGRPLDLSHALLRSVSPIHCEYMRNMGLRASMSVSLLQGDALWGLISCGHRTPRFVPYAVRKACETIGRLLSLQIHALEELEERQLRCSRADLNACLVEAMRRSDGDVLLTLAQRPKELLALADASGVAIMVDEELVTLGDCPTQEQVRALGRWLLERMPPAGLYETFELGADCPAAAAYAERASGMLAASLPKPGGHLVMWFRAEEVQTVHWGGNPHQPAEPDKDAGAARLHPRRSFELWKEVVRGRARRWRSGEVQAVADLRRSAVEIDLERQVLKERQAVRARDDLVAVVSHDLRSPMATVALQATIINRTVLHETSESSLRLRVAADRIHNAIERMNNLIHDLLDLSKIEAGRFHISATVQEVGALLEDAEALMAPIAESKSVALVTATPPDLRIRADPERLYQVLSNLVGNAIKFAPEHSRIEIEATRTDGFAQFSVRDRGPGIPPAQLAHIFERYWQARPEQGKGAGLGLYIARGIVQAHGGKIWVESQPGQGSTFFFTIPLA